MYSTSKFHAFIIISYFYYTASYTTQQEYMNMDYTPTVITILIIIQHRRHIQKRPYSQVNLDRMALQLALTKAKPIRKLNYVSFYQSS